MDRSIVFGGLAGGAVGVVIGPQVADIIVWLVGLWISTPIPPKVLAAFNGIITVGTQLLVTHYVPNSPARQWTQEERIAAGLPAVPAPPPTVAEINQPKEGT